MPIVEVVEGDLLLSDCPVLAQQCNCVTVRSHGLSAQIAMRFPWADIYKQRSALPGRNRARTPSVPGTIQLSKHDGRTIVHLFAQLCPGRSGQFSRVYNIGNDTPEARLKYFASCLRALDAYKFDLVAMPYGIGCGLAGGDWAKYEELLQACATPIRLYRIV